MAIVYIGLGSNLGDRNKHIQSALKLLNKNRIHVLKVSSIIETKPEGGPPQGKFLNAAIKGETNWPPHELLNQLQAIEKKLGREKTVINGPRTIDLDILLYDRITLQSAQLTIPHPRMVQRKFVLDPLREIAPDLVKEMQHACH